MRQRTVQCCKIKHNRGCKQRTLRLSDSNEVVTGGSVTRMVTRDQTHLKLVSRVMDVPVGLVTVSE